MSDLRRLIEWAEPFASTIEESVLLERAQTELDMLQQQPICKHITPCTLCGQDEDTPAPECSCWCHPGSTAQDHANGGL